MVWYEEYDFISNPFTIKPQESFEDFFGQKEIVKKVNDCIEKGNFCLVYGEYGTGKTTIMKGVIEQHKGRRKVVYYNLYTTEKSVDFEDMLVRGGNPISSFFGIKSKDMILLLDEAHNLMKKDFETLISYYNEGYFRSVVLVTSRPTFKFPTEVENLIGNNRTELNMLAEDAAIKLVKSRLEGVELIDNSMIKKILKMSKTPRDFLMKCEEACKNAVERGSEKVEDEDIENLK